MALLKTLAGGLIAAILILSGSAAMARALDAAGRIIDVSGPGTVTIIRADGEQKPAEYPRLLFPGDRFSFRGKATVVANIYGREQRFDQDSPATIVARDGGARSAADESWYDQFEILLSSHRRAIPSSNVTRDPAAPTPPPLMPNPLASPGRQCLPPATTEPVILWRGGSVTADVVSGKSVIPMPSGSGQSWLKVRREGLGTAFTVKLPDGLVWQFETCGPMPSPPWHPPGRPPASESERLVRATWLLKSGPAEWRSAALSELVTLAESGDFGAAELWKAARSGELSEFFASESIPQLSH
ncbi:MAG: hypothetical protein ACOYO0_01055 [Sandarakinorhabdus sp.]